MCYRIHIDKANKLAQVKAAGTVNSHELKELFTETVTHEDWLPGYNILCDYRNIDDFDVTSADIDEITEWLISIDEQIGGGRCAVVASKDSVYGMSRMWEIISSGRRRSQQISIFRRMEDAVSWLDS